MSKERKIINTNIRLNLMEPADQEAWNHLQHMDRKKYKSYSRAVVTALNDYFRREDVHSADPYLETREKEDQFLQKVLDTIELGARKSMPMVIMNSLVSLLQPAAMQIPSHSIASDQSEQEGTYPAADFGYKTVSSAEEESALDDALDFADSF